MQETASDPLWTMLYERLVWLEGRVCSNTREIEFLKKERQQPHQSRRREPSGNASGASSSSAVAGAAVLVPPIDIEAAVAEVKLEPMAIDVSDISKKLSAHINAAVVETPSSPASLSRPVHSLPPRPPPPPPPGPPPLIPPPPPAPPSESSPLIPPPPLVPLSRLNEGFVQVSSPPSPKRVVDTGSMTTTTTVSLPSSPSIISDTGIRRVQSNVSSRPISPIVFDVNSAKKKPAASGKRVLRDDGDKDTTVEIVERPSAKKPRLDDDIQDAGGTSSAGIARGTTPPAAAAPNRTDICRKYQKGKCHRKCSWDHVCLICLESHKLVQCPYRSEHWDDNCIHWNAGECNDLHCRFRHECLLCDSTKHDLAGCWRCEDIPNLAAPVASRNSPATLSMRFCEFFQKGVCKLSSSDCPKIHLCVVCRSPDSKHSLQDCRNQMIRDYRSCCLKWNSQRSDCLKFNCKYSHKCIGCGSNKHGVSEAMCGRSYETLRR
ncbi:hypothetical protein BDR26DRAFT_872627, partial [Obelidium mucronatum]